MTDKLKTTLLYYGVLQRGDTQKTQGDAGPRQQCAGPHRTAADARTAPRARVLRQT